MKTINTWQTWARRLAAWGGALLFLALAGIRAQAQAPLVELSFSEATGTTTTNSGSLGGAGLFVQAEGRPLFTNRVPVGAFAPLNNLSSVDFGDIAAGQGGRAIDLTTSLPTGTLGSLTAFTVCGWVNSRNLNEGFGGNRIAFALESPNGPGFDLVQTAGALRIGINQWPDGSGGGGPLSNPGVITADSTTGTNNWVFFAVTYDSALASGHLKYYFGRHNQQASLSTAHNYARGAIQTSGRLTVGNFGSVVAARNELGPSGGSRVFRGLVDEVRVFDRALSPVEIQGAQTSSSFIPVNAAPMMAQLVPASNTTVRLLRQLEVVFNESVQGVQAADLLVNGTPATSVLAVAPDDYVFQFPEQPSGSVTFGWASGHGIQDFGAIPENFAGGSWTNGVDPSLLALPPIISEFMADNDNTLNDEDGTSSDWIEIHNPDTEPVNLDGFFLTDTTNNLAQWRFPAVSIPGQGYIVVFASEKNRTNPAAPLHTSFKLDNNGEYLALLGPQTNVLSEFRFPAQREDVSFGRDRLTPDLVGFFNVPTPGKPNSVGGSGFAPEVKFSVASGTFTTPFPLTLSSGDPNAVIRYILVNNSATASSTNVPGTNSSLYTGPLQITNTVQVRARTFANGMLPGTPVSETYIFIETNVLQRSSDLPLVVVHTLGGGDFNTTTYKNAHVSVHDTVYGRATLETAPSVTSRASLRVRGNTSANSAKKSWTMELRDEFDQDQDRSLLGMPAESDWVLYGPNNIEPVYIHNPFAYQLARDLGTWAPRTRFVELYLNTTGGPITTNHYWGLYILTEKVKVADGRIEEERLEPEHTNAPAVTGTYLMQVDRVESGETGVRFPAVLPNTLSSGGNAVTYTEPKESEIRLPQRDPQEQYILNYLTNFVSVLNSPGYADPANGYPAFVNLAPSIDNHLIKTLCFSVDAFNFSSYFHKARGGKLTFGPIWDFDRSLESNDHRDADPRVWRSAVEEKFDFFNYSWWGRMFQDTNFFQLWVDRYQELRASAFSQENLMSLIDGLAQQCRESQVRDVARWPAVTTPRFGGYQGEVDHMKEWLTNRLHFMDTNFLARPTLSTGDARIEAGFTFTISPPLNKPGTQIYFTLDGTDPRLPGGSVSPAALLYTGSVTVDSNTHIVARCFNATHRNLTGGPSNGNPPAVTPWSGPVRALLIVNEPALRITEIMYHPAAPVTGNTNDADNFEFIEVKNTGVTPLNLNRFRFTEGIHFEFPNVSLAGGQSGVVVRSVSAFQARYGTVPLILGSFTGQLDNAGERLRLEGAVREPIHDFQFDDEWYPITDGFGFSLVIRNDQQALGTWPLQASWRPSGALGGSPGQDDPVPPSFGSVVVNEALTHTDLPQIDAVELRNLSGTTSDLGGWYLTDDFRTPKKYRFPNQTSIAPNGYLAVYETNFNAGLRPFSLSSTGDELYLFSADLAGNLTGYYHGFDFGPQFNGVTFGRHLISTGEDHFVAQASPSLGTMNSGPRVGPIVITEIHYQPVDVFANNGFWNNTDDEYLELYNPTSASVPLFDPAFPTNTWRLRDAVEFTFPPGFTIPAGGFILITSIDPNDVGALSDFRLRNGVSASVQVLGPYTGRLDNAGDSVELVRPDAPPTPPDSGEAPFVLVDKVRYSNREPWPAGAAGIGGSLQRVDASAYGNDPANWVALAITPGAPNPGGTLPVITAQPQDATAIQTHSASFTVSASGAAPLRYQWQFNGQSIFGATNSTLTLNNVQPAQSGLYRCFVLNSGGIVGSSNALLSVLLQAKIIQHPQSISLRGSTNSVNYGFTTNNAVFTIAASSSSPLSYRWRFNGTPIDGATNTSLTVSNVDLSHDGIYDVALTDSISTSFSNPARLTVLLTPILIQPPLPQIVPAGGRVTVSVGITGNPAPFMYRWLSNSLLMGSYVSDQRTNFFSFTASTNIATVNFRLIVTNAAFVAPGATIQFAITTVADFDRDGLPDDFERSHGMATNDSSDASIDLDGDTMSNAAEYLAGTNPTNALSYLKIGPPSGGFPATVSFEAVSNRTYSIQYSDTMPAAIWTRLADVIARPVNRLEMVLDPNWTTNRFYRLVLPAQP